MDIDGNPTTIEKVEKAHVDFWKKNKEAKKIVKDWNEVHKRFKMPERPKEENTEETKE